VTKKKKLVKRALAMPELYTPAELTFFRRWLEERKRRKLAKKANKLEQTLQLGEQNDQQDQ
jgi:hypothetical protein